jgi:Cft2 family RNA processing exonuclease
MAPVDPLVVVDRHGLHVPAAALWLDAADAPGRVFVSHAHGDHLSGADALLCTRETAALQARRSSPWRRPPVDVLTLPFGTAAAVGDAEVILHPAGHTLGSAMLEARTPHGTLVYTGDFKRRANPFSPPVTVPRCDVLVMECTFGDPRYRFPPDDDVVAALLGFVRDALADGVVPIVCAYPFGKSQEALWHLTRAGLDVAVHGQIAAICEAHEALGHGFPGEGRWTRYQRGDIAGRVLLTTPGSRKSAMVTALPRRRTCLLTGWALHPGAHQIYRDCDLVLPLSDHADFDALVATARESGAAHVYTVHGAPGFAAHLRALGVAAEHLAAHPQAPPDAVQLGLGL